MEWVDKQTREGPVSVIWREGGGNIRLGLHALAAESASNVEKPQVGQQLHIDIILLSLAKAKASL